MTHQPRAVGHTAAQGWEIGVRRTFATTPEVLWATVMTSPGLDLWLGPDVELTLQKKAPYVTGDGTTGEIRSVEEGRLLRMTWQPPQWNFASTVQIRIVRASTGATLSIHHEKLQDGAQRERMRHHWASVLDQLGHLIEPK